MSSAISVIPAPAPSQRPPPAILSRPPASPGIGDGDPVEADPWLGWNPFAADSRDKLFPALHRLRELDPVNRMPIGLWRLTRYADVVRLLKETPCGMRTSDGRSFIQPLQGESRPRDLFMLLQDPPVHTRLRRLVSRAFIPSSIHALRGRVQGIVDECLDKVQARGEMDVVADLALPVPSIMICEMLGVPVADREMFTEWTAQATHALSPGPFADPALQQRAFAAGDALIAYFEVLIEKRRHQPSDDLLSALIRAEEAGDRLSHEELLSQAIGLLIAGFETTIGLISNGVRALIRHPDELAKLRAKPELIKPAVEECLRYDGPIALTIRILHADAEFGGKQLSKDSIVMAVLAAANRDPEVFEDPDRFDIERDPNPHMAFGGGAHYCLGAHLARLEAQVAIGSLFQRFDDVRLVREQVEWGPSMFRVPARLPITFRPR